MNLRMLLGLIVVLPLLPPAINMAVAGAERQLTLAAPSHREAPPAPSPPGPAIVPEATGETVYYVSESLMLQIEAALVAQDAEIKRLQALLARGSCS